MKEEFDLEEFEAALRRVAREERLEDLLDLLKEFEEGYRRFANVSSRILKIFSKLLHRDTTDLRLSDYLLTLFDMHPKMTRGEIEGLVKDSYPSYTTRSITNALQYLKGQGRISYDQTTQCWERGEP